MSDINSLLGHAMPAVGAAVSAYGVAVLSQAEAEAAQATVQLGQRLLHRILRRTPDPAPIEAAVTDLAGTADDDALAALRFQIRQVLLADPSLVAEWTALLPEQPAVRADGARSVAVAGDQTGIVSTGDGTMNVQHR